MPDVRALQADELSEIGAFAGHAAAWLDVSDEGPPEDVVGAINTQLRAIEDGATARPEDDLVMGLGLLLGEQYKRAFGWTWAYVTWEDGYAAHTVVSPDRSLAITPIQWVNAISKGEKTTNVLLSFNMVAAGNHPPVAPGACELFH